MVVAAGVGTTLLLALLVLGATAVNQSAGGPQNGTEATTAQV